MSQYLLSIVTPTGKTFEGEVSSLIAPGELGAFGVLTRHAPTVTALKKGVLKLTLSSGEKFFAIGRGVFEMDPQNKALILSDSAVEANNFQDAQEKLKILD